MFYHLPLLRHLHKQYWHHFSTSKIFPSEIWVTFLIRSVSLYLKAMAIKIKQAVDHFVFHHADILVCCKFNSPTHAKFFSYINPFGAEPGIFYDYKVNTITADALAPYVARRSAAMVLLVLHEEGCQSTVSAECQEMRRECKGVSQHRFNMTRVKDVRCKLSISSTSPGHTRWSRARFNTESHQ